MRCRKTAGAKVRCISALTDVTMKGAQFVGAPPAGASAGPSTIASVTKSFTAMALLKLRDEGRLSLDEPAARLRRADKE